MVVLNAACHVRLRKRTPRQTFTRAPQRAAIVKLRDDRRHSLDAIRTLLADGHMLRDAVREASIGRVRPKLMTAGTATLGLLPLVVLQLHGTEIERPLAIVMIGGLITSPLFTLLVLPPFYLQVHGWLTRRESHDTATA